MDSRLATLAGLVGALVACGGSNNTPLDARADARIDAPPDGPPVPKGIIAVPLTSLDQLSYTGPLMVGDQQEAVILDTGSTTFGVASSTCTNCGVTPVYTPGHSAMDQDETGSATYGDGTGWAGEIYSDYVQLGSSADIEIKFVAITSQSGFFRSFTGTGAIGYQGILGLGPDAILLGGTTSYATTAFAAGVPSELAFQLCPDSGTMWIGGIDTAAEASAPAITPLLANFPYYGITVDQVAVGSGSSVGSASDFGPTIIDTGTSISFIPTTPLTTLTTEIQNSTGFQTVFGSQSLTDMTTMGCVSTTMNGAEIDATLPQLQIAFPTGTGSDSPLVNLPATKSYLVAEGGGEWCFAFADSSELAGSATLSLFGDSLLNSYITVFDVGEQQLELAPETGCDEAVSDARARMTRRSRVPGIPWWRQDPGVRLPHPEELQRRLAAFVQR